MAFGVKTRDHPPCLARLAFRIDSTCIKDRHHGRIACVAVIIAVGVNNDGLCDIHGLATGAFDVGPIWTDLPLAVDPLGPCGVDFVASDAHEGITAAVSKAPNVASQPCRRGRRIGCS